MYSMKKEFARLLSPSKSIAGILNEKYYLLYALVSSGFLSTATSFLISWRFNDPEHAIIALIFGVGLESLAWVGFGINHLDIAPRYAGVLFGMSGTCATIPAILSPLVVGTITDSQDRDSWVIIFNVSAFMFIFGALFYNCFGSADRQRWAADPLEKLINEEEIESS